jgi:hypothetical protein
MGHTLRLIITRAIVFVLLACQVLSQSLLRVRVVEQAQGLPAAGAAALALFEWDHESVLGPAGVLGPPIEIVPQARPLVFLAALLWIAIHVLDCLHKFVHGAIEEAEIW